MAVTKKINFKTGLNMREFLFLVFLICSAGSSTILQLLSLFIFSIGFLFVGTKIRFTHRWFFYVGLLFLSLIQLLFVWKSDYGISYFINTLFITLMWFLALQCSNIVVNNVSKIATPNIEKVVNLFFKLNVYVVLLQVLWMCIAWKTLFPFEDMSAGDNVKGFFRNSSVNMIIMSFYTVYYLYKKKFKHAIISGLVMVTTFYMSGLLIFVTTVFTVLFLKFKLKNKLKIVAGVVVLLFLFIQFNPKNAQYVERILSNKIHSKTDPPRKLVSFGQTYESWTKSPDHFLFGVGGGKFSSRSAFITAGEYVGWFPQSLVYISEDFKENHFPLWNKKILSIPYKDGTSNQPFSFYNKIIGEYGLIGLSLFVIYLLTAIKNYKKLSYGRLIFILMFPFFLLDYWFEYFSVIIFFELFLLLNIKSKTQTSHERTE